MEHVTTAAKAKPPTYCARENEALAIGYRFSVSDYLNNLYEEFILSAGKTKMLHYDNHRFGKNFLRQMLPPSSFSSKQSVHG